MAAESTRAAEDPDERAAAATDLLVAIEAALLAFVIPVARADDASSRRAEAANGFRHVIDLALAIGGSYYLTYHRYADRRQVEAAHPGFREFLAAKARLDPGRFQSDWYRHYREELYG